MDIKSENALHDKKVVIFMERNVKLLEKFKKILCFILLFSMILTGINLNSFNIAVAVPNVEYEGSIGAGGYLYANEKTVLPSGVKWINQNGFKLNLTIFKEKNIAVYGYWGSINSNINDFKKGTIPAGDTDNNRINLNDGYYTKNGVKGEYRYHGYTYEGGLHNNANFPVDVAMKKPAQSYNYLYRYFVPGQPYFSGDVISEMNRVALGMGNSTNDMEINIAKSHAQTILQEAGFSSDGSVPNGTGTGSDKFNAYNYANIKTVPSKFTAGQVELKHRLSDGRIFYADISSPPELTNKIMKQVNLRFDSVKANVSKLKDGDDYIVDVILKAEYDDEGLYTHNTNKHLYYTRYDIDKWKLSIYDTITKQTQEVTLSLNSNDARGRMYDNKAEYKFTITMTKEKYEKHLINNQFDFSMTGKATVFMYNGESAYDIEVYGDESEIEDEDIGKVPAEPITTVVTEDYKPVHVDITSPEKMLDTEKFKLIENTEYENVVDVNVFLDGKLLSSSDARKFLDGNWLFPLKGYDDLYNYRVEYTNELGMIYVKQASVIVYTTKPNAQILLSGTQKENRALVATNNMGAANLNESYFLNRATLSTTNFSISGEEIYVNSQNNSKIEFLSKLSGKDIIIQLDIKAVVHPQYVERYDIPAGYHTGHHTYRLQVMPDYAPAIVSNIWNSVLTRNEELNYMLDIVSTDGDNIAVSTYELYYDEDNDNVAEKLIQSGNTSDFKTYKPDKLGLYKLVFFAKEEFSALESTYSQFITDDDKKTTTIEKEFIVENLAPQTEIYVDVPLNYPEVDIIILNDETISRDLNNNIVNTRVSFMNELIRSSLNPSVQVWDLYTYTYSQTASTTKFTGESYPQGSVSYSSNGYSGTLYLINAINNPYYGIVGYHNETMSDTTTATGYSWAKWSKEGGYSSGSTNTPSVIGSGGRTYYKIDWWEESYTYEETTDETGTVIAWSSYTTYGALYEATWTERVADYDWISDYTGYYTGTIYKKVKQEFNPKRKNR